MESFSLGNPTFLIWVVLIVVVLYTAMRAFRIVEQASVLIVERLGKYHKTAHSGFNFIWPFLDKVRPIFLNGRGFLTLDLREQVIDFPPQPVITRDNVTMAVDTVLYYQITDPAKAVYEIADLGNAIQQLTTTTLRNVMGELALDETLTSRETVNVKLRNVLDEATDKWGVKVNRVELKNIEPPEEIQDAMAKQMKAERERRLTGACDSGVQFARHGFKTVVLRGGKPGSHDDQPTNRKPKHGPSRRSPPPA